MNSHLSILIVDNTCNLPDKKVAVGEKYNEELEEYFDIKII